MAKDPTYPVKKLIYLTDELAREVSEFRFEQRLQSENEAVRRLIEIGLESAKRGRKTGSQALGKAKK